MRARSLSREMQDTTLGACSIRSAPAESVGVKYFHWYLSVIPRLTRVAGFELGSGMFINTVLPEAAAEFLRKVDVESVKNAAATTS